MCNTIIKQTKKLEIHLAKELQDLCNEIRIKDVNKWKGIPFSWKGIPYFMERYPIFIIWKNKC